MKKKTYFSISIILLVISVLFSVVSNAVAETVDNQSDQADDNTQVEATDIDVSIDSADTVRSRDDDRDPVNILDEPALAEITGYGFQIDGKNPGDFTEVPRDALFKIWYDFELLDVIDPDTEHPLDVLADDFIKIVLPPELTAYAEFVQVTDIKVTVDAGEFGCEEDGGCTIGALTITKEGEIRFVFDEDIENLAGVTFRIELDGAFISDSIGNQEKVEFELVADGETIIVEFEELEPDPGPVEASITKSGVYDPATNQITWTITVDPGDKTLTNVRVVDSLGPKQIYKSSSSTPNFSDLIIDGTTYTFKFDEVSEKTYITIVTELDESAFGVEGHIETLTNNVKLFEEGTEDPLDEDDAEVKVETDWIQKTGGEAYEVDGVWYIDWVISANHNYRIIPAGSTITDTLDSYLEYVGPCERSGTGNSDDYQPYTNYGDTCAVSGQVLTYTFRQTGQDISGVVFIRFKTKVRPEYFNQQDQSSFTNFGVLNIGEGSFGEGSDGVGVPTSLLSKEGAGYDPRTQLIAWEMTVNANGRNITAAKIVDEISDENQVFFEDFGVKRDGNDLDLVTTESAFETCDNPSGCYCYNNDTLTIFLGNLSSDDQPVITFKTQVTNPDHYAENLKKPILYKNTATLTGVGIKDSTSTGTQNVTSKVIAKAYTGNYDFDEKTLEWKITVNHNKMYMPGAVVTDTIPDGQAYLDGSMVIVQQNYNSLGDLSSETNLPLQTSPDTPNLDVTDDEQTLTISLGDISIDTMIVITFKTKITDETVFLGKNGDITFNNKAELNSDIPDAPTVKVDADAIVENKALEKGLTDGFTADDIKNSGVISWGVWINSNQAPLINAVLSDTLQSGLELVDDSVKLFKWNPNENPKIGDEVDIQENPTLPFFTYDFVTREFIFYLPDGAQGYYLTFDTLVLLAGKTYNNSIQMEGSTVGEDIESDAKPIAVYDVDWDSTGFSGAITIDKFDSEDETVKLTGAVFNLLDSAKRVMRTATTDANGSILFKPVKPGRTYYLQEVKAPLGYKLDASLLEVVLGTDQETRHITEPISNVRLTASVILGKIDDLGLNLNGGRFGIFREDDDTLVKEASAVNGSIRFEGMLPGNYYIQEIESPEGHHLNDEKISVELNLDVENNTLDDFVFEDEDALINQRIIGEIELRKVNPNLKPLAGAVFGLYDSEDQLIAEVTSEKDGIIRFIEVLYGEYTIKEIKPPKGYEPMKEVITVSLTQDETVTYTTPYDIVNKPIASGIPQTGSFWGSNTILLLGSLMMLAAGGLLFYLSYALANDQRQI